MKPQEEAQAINSFVDGELDLGLHLEMEARMREDAGLREEIESLRQLRAAIRDGADYHAAPAGLRARLARISVSGTDAPTSLLPPAAASAWRGWRPLAAALALVAVPSVTMNIVGWRWGGHERMQDDVIASHVRSTLGLHLIDVASSDRHTVKPWLSSKLDFSPPVSELNVPGSVLLGGRVDYLDGHPVAALVYRQREHIVNAFVWPGAAEDSAADFSSARGFQLAHWTQNGMQHWVISDLNRQEFAALIGAVREAASQR